MNLSAPLLTALSRCERRFQLEREYAVVRRRPREVFNDYLQTALLRLAGGWKAQPAAEEMSARLIEYAAHPGFDVSQDPYPLTQDLCAIAHTALEYIGRRELRLGRRGPQHGWEFSSLCDPYNGDLERWIAVESWNEQEQFRQLHSWYVYGDCCAGESAMRIHVIEVGPLRNGHYHTDWARCFKHPHLENVYRFRQKTGARLEGAWRPVWMQDLLEKNARDWVDGMERDQAAHIEVLKVAQPLAADLERFASECDSYRAIIRGLPSWERTLMRRASCDVPPNCPWQAVCYARSVSRVEDLGSFVKVGELETSLA